MPWNTTTKRLRTFKTLRHKDRASLRLWQLEERDVPAGTVQGTVFLDYNANGIFETGNPTINNNGAGGSQTVGVARDVGFGAGITVTAYDPNNVVRGTATTLADGTYTLNLTGTGPYRLHFAGLPANSSTFYGPVGTNNGTSIRFLADPNGGTVTGIDLGIVQTVAYAQNNPLLITSRFVFGAADGPNSGFATVQSFPYSAGRNIVDGVNGDGGASIPDYQNPTAHAINIRHSSVGSVWGLAEDENTARLFMAAFMKRHTGFGPLGTGGIYAANIPPMNLQNINDVVTTATPFANLNTATDLAGSFGLPGGTNFRGATHDYLTDGLSGNLGWDSVGKLGLGGLEISPDGRFLYTIGLNTRRLYVLDTTNPTVVRSYALPVFNDPTTGITGINVNNPLGDLRPFAVQWHNGSIYVGAVNSAESTYTSNSPTDRGDASRLRAYVFRFNPGASPVSGGTGQFVDLSGAATTAPVLNIPLNYARGYTHPGASPAPADDFQSEWLPWSPIYRNLNLPRDGAREAVYPQPMLTGLSFDADGNMVLGLRDRAGDQFGAFTPADPNNPGNFMVGVTSGDMLRAFGNATTGWTLESNGADPRIGSPGGSSAAGVGNAQGPGGGEFYSGDYLVPGIFTGIQDHNEVSAGGVLQIPGFPDALSTVFDPAQVSQRYNAGGVRWYANSGATAGNAVKAYELYQVDINPNLEPPPLFAKSNGIGDLVAFSNPIVELGNRIWNDLNGNGVQDADEPGIANVQVFLLNSSGQTIATATTDAGGNYYFSNAMSSTPPVGGRTFVNPFDSSPTANDALVAGRTYTIRIPVAQPPLAGLIVTTQNAVISGVNDPDSVDSDASPTGDITVTALTINESNHTYDAGFRTPPILLSVGDFVWNDANNNGQWDQGELPIAGVQVQLVNIGAGTTLTQATNTSGGYLFTDLQPGQYRIQIPTGQAALAGFISSTGTPRSATGPFEPVVGDPANNLDHGTTNAAQTFVEGPILNLTIGGAPLNETLPANGGDRGIPEAAERDPHSYRNQDFGFWQPVSIGDRVWVDANNNGLREVSEAPLPGVTVQLLDGSGTLLTSTVTNANGGYLFTYLTPGQYQVRLVRDAALNGYTSSTGTVGSATGPFEPVTGDPANDNDHGTQIVGFINGPIINATAGGATLVDPATIPAGLPFDPAAPTSRYRNQDFGVFQPLALGDFVWEDVNNNGVLDAGENPISGVLVELLNGSGQPLLDANGKAITSTTNTAGNYLFTNLVPGDYRVRITPPSGFVTSTGKNGSTTGPFEPGVNDFSNNTDHGSRDTLISGRVITGVVTLGAPGSASNPAALDGFPNRANLSQDFGLYRPLAIGDLVFRDVNNNGVFDNGSDFGISGVTVRLLDASNNVIAEQLTNVNGLYRFDNLAPGQYRVEIVPPAGLTSSTGNGFPANIPGPYEPAAQTNNNSEDKGTLDPSSNTIRTPILTLGLPGSTGNPDEAGLANLRQDFGLISPPVVPPPPPPITNPAQISGFVYVDNNINGLREPGERPIGGVRILLNGTTNSGATVQLTTFTDGNGFYQFTNLQPGTYTVREEQPRGNYYDGLDTIGTVGGVPRGVAGNDILRSITLNAGDVGINYNFAEIEPTSTFGYVWVDANRNSIRDPSEEPIPGVAVTVSGTAFAGTSLARPLTAADVPYGLTVFTNAEGRYDFPVLPPGEFNLSETQPVDFDDWMEQNGDPYGGPVGIFNDLFTGIQLTAAAPIRGPFNFGEVLSTIEEPPGESPQTPSDPTKRAFLGSSNVSASAAPATPARALLSTVAQQPSAGVNAPVTPLILQPRFDVRTGTPSRPTYVVAASGVGITPMVRVFDYATGLEKFRIQAYESSFTGGVRASVADVNGDGIPDIVTATGVGGGPRIRVFNGVDGTILQDFFAYEDTYRGGVSLTTGDVDGDGIDDIIAGTDLGGGPRVRVFSGRTGGVIYDFFAFDANQRGGVRVAAADFNGDGRDEIITTTGPGVPTLVRVYDAATLALLSEFRPYGNNFTGGVFVSAGDFNGDGTPDIITGADAGGGPHVQVFSGLTATSIASFFAYESRFTGGVRVAAADVNGDGRVEIITGAGNGGGARVSIYSGAGINLVDDFFAYDVDHSGGVYVAAGTGPGPLLPVSTANRPASTGELGKPGSLPEL